MTNKQKTSFCPGCRSACGCKTGCIETAFACTQGNRLHRRPNWRMPFFEDSIRYQKHKVKKIGGYQSAMEGVDAGIAGTNDEQEQNWVIVAYGDGDKNGTVRGTPPTMSTK